MSAAPIRSEADPAVQTALPEPLDAQRRRTRESREEEERLATEERLLAELTEALAWREAEFAADGLALARFRLSYLARFAALYAELDRLEAEILGLIAERTPASAPEAETARTRAEAAQARADESERAAEGAAEDTTIRTEPSADIKDLYREVAKAVHPDLATDDEDRDRRTRLMVAANLAYSEADADALRSILDGEAARACPISGDDTEARLARVLRQIAQVRARFEELAALRAVLRADPMWALYLTVCEASEGGGDPLERIERDLRWGIRAARERLAALRVDTGTSGSR